MTTLEQIDLAVSGMTCGACATKIEKALNQIDGVTATV
ncbi:MAG: cation transporter, partial [Actinomycetota bacterium]